jgi:hypothetical protein
MDCPIARVVAFGENVSETEPAAEEPLTTVRLEAAEIVGTPFLLTS